MIALDCAAADNDPVSVASRFAMYMASFRKHLLWSLLIAVAVLGCSPPAAGESVAPGYGGFQVAIHNDLDDWILAYSDRHFADLPVSARQSRAMDWFGTKDPLDEGGNEKTARVEAYRLAGAPPRTDADQDLERGELVFCREFSFRELSSLGWTIRIVPGDVRCEPRRLFVLPDAQ